MKLPEHIIAIGHIDGDRTGFFHEVKQSGFSVFTAETVNEVLCGDKDLLGPFRYALSPGSHMHNRSEQVVVVDATLPVWSSDAGREFVFDLILEGNITPGMIKQMVYEIRDRRLTVTPEEREWMDAHGFVPDRHHRFNYAYRLGNATFIPELSNHAYPRAWRVRYESQAYDNYNMPYPIQVVCAGLTRLPEIYEIGESLFDALTPEDDRWLREHEFNRRITRDGLRFQKDENGFTFSLTLEPANLQLGPGNIWKATWEHWEDGALTPDLSIREETVSAPTAAGVYQGLLKATSTYLTACTEKLDEQIRKLQGRVEAIARMRGNLEEVDRG